MPITVNLRHLETHEERLEGELPEEELDIETHDEVIGVAGPLRYDLEVQKMEHGVLAQGRLSLPLACQCVRCLKPFELLLKLEHWSCHVQLQGEEAVKVVNDCVDLTPFVREDILLEFPQHPVCQSGCRGLPDSSVRIPERSDNVDQPASEAWSELNKLKL